MNGQTIFETYLGIGVDFEVMKEELINEGYSIEETEEMIMKFSLDYGILY